MPLKVMLIDDTPGRAALLRQALTDAGYTVAAHASTGEDLIAAVARADPDVVICDLEAPDRDTLEHMRHISDAQPRPIVMFAEHSDGETIARAIKAGVSAYVVNGLDTARIRSIMDVAIARFREFHALRRELAETRTRLEDRKVIEKAKGMLMARRGLSEDDAYGALRKLAMERNQRLGEVARAVLSMLEVIG